MTDLRTAAQQALEALIENARLLGGTQAKKGFGCYSQEDARLERAWHEGIAKHSAALRAALAQQAEPVQEQDAELSAALGWPGGISNPVLDRKVLLQKVAALAQQAEPVEPVAKVELMTTGGNAGLATRIVEIDDHLRERLRPGQLLYTAPPQRQPLTDEEATALVQSVVSNSDRPIGMVAYGLLVVGAVERAHGIGDNT